MPTARRVFRHTVLADAFKTSPYNPVRPAPEPPHEITLHLVAAHSYAASFIEYSYCRGILQLAAFQMKSWQHAAPV